MSAQQLITEHIDLWTSSIKARNTQGRGSSKKRELYGIKKLRELILELAVRGKLVPQDANDEAASVLIEKSLSSKEALANSRKIRKDKETYQAVAFFKAPRSWEWLCIGQFSHVLGGKRVPRGYSLLDTPTKHIYIRVTDMKNGTVLPDGLKYIDTDIYDQISKYVINKEDVYVTIAGTIGAVGIIPENLDGMSMTENSSKLVFRDIEKRFIAVALSANYIQGQFSESVNQMAQPKLSLTSIKHVSIVLPPIEEQHRIVAKVDELMALCDQLEQQTESSLDAHNLLVDTLLSTLTNARDAKELSDNWARLADHFDTLITTDYAVEQLKQTIFQLAVMGKLVPQDPNDEPASELLKRIAAEKSLLIKGKKVKTQKPLPKITDEEKLFVLPVGWEWVRLGTLYEMKYGDNLPKTKRSETGEYPVYGSNGIVGSHNECCIGEPCIVIGRKGSAGALNLCSHNGCWVTDVAYSVVPPKDLDINFVFKSFHTMNLDALGKGIKPGLNRNEAYVLVLAIPPLPEQRRIVAKVDELMALCDQLKTQLKDAQTIQLHLSDAVVENALTA